MKVFKTFIKWLGGLLRDERGNPSSKRFVGIIAGLSLCASLFINLFTEHPVDHTLVNAVAALAFGALGLASVDKIWAKKEEHVKDSAVIKEPTEMPISPIEQINS